MAVINLRGVPDNLAAQLKSEAALAGLGYHDYCVVILSNRGSMGLTLAKIEASRKKIAEVSLGGGTTEGGGDPSLPRGGKAQDEEGFIPAGIVGDFKKMKELAKTNIETAKLLHEAGIELDSEILERWGLAENDKPKLEGEGNGKGDNPAGRGQKAKGGGVAGGDSKTVAEGADGGKGNAVATGKPGVNMQALRDIAAGKGIRPAPLSAEPIEVDLCGFKSYNEIDGENYVCGKEVHGPKVKHGEWIKI